MYQQTGSSPVNDKWQAITWNNIDLFSIRKKMTVSKTLGNTFQWNFVWNSKVFIVENTLEMWYPNGEYFVSVSLC